MTDPRSVLFFARDPGPANQVVAARELLLAAAPDPAEVGARAFRAACGGFAGAAVVAGLGAALEVFRRAGLDPLDWRARAPDGELPDLLRAWNIGAVVTGTSDVDDDTDRLLWAAAAGCGIDSHAFLDFPSALAERFRCRDGRVIHPAHVYVPDDGFVAALVAAGVAPARVRVCGPIHQRRLARLAGAAAATAAARLRAAWGARTGETVLLFASQCLIEMAAAGRPSPHNELAVLDQLTARLARAEAVPGLGGPLAEPVVVVRPHPRDSAGKYGAWCAADSGRPRRVVSAEGSPEEAILAADVVVGLDSSLLRDALVLGRRAVSLTGARIDLAS